MSVLSRFVPRASLPLSETTRSVLSGRSINKENNGTLFYRYEELNRFWRTAKKRAVGGLVGTTAPHAVQCLINKIKETVVKVVIGKSE